MAVTYLAMKTNCPLPKRKVAEYITPLPLCSIVMKTNCPLPNIIMSEYIRPSLLDYGDVSLKKVISQYGYIEHVSVPNETEACIFDRYSHGFLRVCTRFRKVTVTSNVDKDLRLKTVISSACLPRKNNCRHW